MQRVPGRAYSRKRGYQDESKGSCVFSESRPIPQSVKGWARERVSDMMTPLSLPPSPRTTNTTTANHFKKERQRDRLDRRTTWRSASLSLSLLSVKLWKPGTRVCVLGATHDTTVRQDTTLSFCLVFLFASYLYFRQLINDLDTRGTRTQQPG